MPAQPEAQTPNLVTPGVGMSAQPAGPLGDLAGWHHHTSAIGELVDSLYAAGRAELRHGPDDPAPGVASIHAVRPLLDVRRLDRVVSIQDQPVAVQVQSRCSLVKAMSIVERRGWRLQGWTGQGDVASQITVGAALLQRMLRPCPDDWAEVLLASGMVERHPAGALPPDALLTLLSLGLEPLLGAAANGEPS